MFVKNHLDGIYKNLLYSNKLKTCFLKDFQPKGKNLLTQWMRFLLSVMLIQIEDLCLIQYGWLVTSDLLLNVGNTFAFEIVNLLQKKELALFYQRSRCPLTPTFLLFKVLGATH